MAGYGSIPPVILTALLASACTPEPPDTAKGTSNNPVTTPTEPTEPSTGTTQTTQTSSTDTGTDTPWETEVDCSQLNPLPVSYETHTWAPPAEDFTLSADGYMFVGGGGITRTPFGGPTELLIPDIGDVRGTRFLPDGTLALAHIETGSILNVDPATGARTVLAAGLSNPNGIAIGADGRVYVATSERIVRIDPASGDVEVVVEMTNRSFDGLTFASDYSRLYFNEELGRVHWVDIAPDGTVGSVGGPIQLPIGAFSLLDGMAADACGNLYVAEMGGIVWRVSPSGAIDEVVNLVEPLAVTPALNFGIPDTGGWDPTVLYVNDFLGKLYALEIGVPGKWEPHI